MTDPLEHFMLESLKVFLIVGLGFGLPAGAILLGIAHWLKRRNQRKETQ